MKLPIEDWVEQKGFNNNIKQLFGESLICFKNGAYRAGLLYSHTAFLTIVRNIILKGKKPLSIQQSRWDSITQKLQNEDSWEEAVLDELFNSSSSIFLMKEHVRQQIRYWKDRRNDSAHYKDNAIESYHIESYWSFLQSNLSKITLEGGKDSLIQKFVDHFNDALTPPGTDFSYLIQEIDSAVEKSELQIFFDELLGRIDPYLSASFNSIGVKICNSILELTEVKTTEELVSYLRAKQYDLILITFYLEKIHLFKYSATEIRNIWKVRIYSNGFREMTCKVFAALLRNRLIPVAEITEACDYLFEKYDQNHSSSFCYSDSVHLALSEGGFGDTIFKKAITEHKLSNYYWVNGKCDLIAYYVEYYSLNEETVKYICQMSTSPNPSQWLIKELLRIFEEKPLKKIEFINIAKQKGYSAPKLTF